MPDDIISRRSLLSVAVLSLTGCFGESTGVIVVDPWVRFDEPKNGATVSIPFKVRFGLHGYQVAPSGDYTTGTGHHHLIIDGPEFIDENTAIPFGKVGNTIYIHHGNREVEAMVNENLSEGAHRLTAQFANGGHVSLGPKLADSIVVNVVRVPIG